MAPPSRYYQRSDDDTVRFVMDGDEIAMAGITRMHFYRLAGTTPEEATDEQVERFFALRSQENETGERVTSKLPTESATDMVTRELKILNLPQVMNPRDPFEADNVTTSWQKPFDTGSSAALQAEPQTTQPHAADMSPLGAPPRYQPGGALPSAPRYTPAGESGGSARLSPPPPSAPPDSPRQQDSSDTPQSRYVRAEGTVLWLQTPDGNEQRVTQYMRTHFLRMVEKDIVEATDGDIELWWKLQGSLDAGTSLQEAQSQNMLAEALKAAGKLRLRELAQLEQVIQSWLAVRRSEDDGS